MHLDTTMRIVDGLYEAALCNGDWNDVLIDIADLGGVANAALVTVDPHLGASSVLTPRADPHIIDSYASHWWRKDVTAAATGAMEVGRITTLDDTGRDVFFASEFHNDFWSRSGLGAERAAVNLFVGDGAFASFVLQAAVQRDEITTDTMRLVEFLVPHLIRAVDIQRKMRLLDYNRQLAQTGQDHPGVGLIFVNAVGRVIVADCEAEVIIAQRDDIDLRQGLVELDTPGATAQLYRLIRWADGQIRGGEMQVTGLPGREPLTLQVLPYTMSPGSDPGGDIVPFAPHAILLLQDRTRQFEAWTAQLTERHDLTNTEARVAIEIARGGGSAAVAERLSIALSTVRTHLSRIFEKTGTARQAELVALLARAGINP